MSFFGLRLRSPLVRVLGVPVLPPSSRFSTHRDHDHVWKTEMLHIKHVCKCGWDYPSWATAEINRLADELLVLRALCVKEGYLP